MTDWKVIGDNGSDDYPPPLGPAGECGGILIDSERSYGAAITSRSEGVSGRCSGFDG